MFQYDACGRYLPDQRAFRERRPFAVLAHIHEDEALGRVLAVHVNIQVQVRQVERAPGT